jgi:hypothetical protein
LITYSGTIGANQIPGTIQIINNSTGLNHPVDAPEYSGNIGIRIRGSATNPKKSYNIETWTNIVEQPLNASLLGMPSENDWVLLAEYTDRSLMRDLIGFHIYEQMGSWAPRMKLVEVMVNNSYEGVYLFGERIKRDVNRLDIATLTNTDVSGYELTGGYIFKIDDDNDDYWTSSFTPPYATTGQNIQFHFEEPDDNTITPVQKVYIKAYTDSFETALNGPDFQDTTIGWRKFGAHNSFNEFLIFNEVMKSKDAYRRSTFMFKDKGKKLRMGPVWDLELALYNTADCNASQDNGWAYQYGQACNTSTYLPPFWWEKLVTDTAFLRETKCKYTIYRESVLDTANLYHFIDSIATLLNVEQAQTRNFQKWPIWGVPLINEPAPVSTNYAEEITKIKGFISRRLQYLDNQWLTPGCILGVTETTGLVTRTAFYPNPATETVTMELNLQKAAKLTVVLRDILGRNVGRYDYPTLKAGGHTFSYPLSELTAGLYYVSVIADNVPSGTFKLIKQ